MPGAGKKPLSIFEFPLKTWEEFVVIKLLADLAEILQVEDLLHCTFHPLRNLARVTMPEERFHAQFGEDFCAELCQTQEGRAKVQEAIDRYFPMLPAFFGGAARRTTRFSASRKSSSAPTTRCAPIIVEKARALVEDHLKLKLPETAEAA